MYKHRKVQVFENIGDGQQTHEPLGICYDSLYG